MPPTSHLPTKHIQTLQTHAGAINTITFSHLGGTFTLTGSSDRQIHLSRTEPSSSTTTTTTTTTSSNNKPTQQQSPQITTAPIQKYTSHGYAVLSITVSSQNTHFASSGGDRAVFYWDIQTPTTTLRRFGTNTPQAHSSRVTCVSFAGQDDGVLVSGSDDRSVRLWDVKSRDPRPLQVWDEARDGVSALVVVPGIPEVVVGSVDGRVRAYDLRMGRVVVDVHPGPVTSLDLTRDGRCLLVGCLDGRIRLMDRETGVCLRAVPDGVGLAGAGAGGYENESLRLQSCLAANESLVLSGSEGDGKVRAWDVVSGKLLTSLDVGENNKVVSVVRWRQGSKAQSRQDVWAAGGADGVVTIFGE